MWLFHGDFRCSFLSHRFLRSKMTSQRVIDILSLCWGRLEKEKCLRSSTLMRYCFNFVNPQLSFLDYNKLNCSVLEITKFIKMTRIWNVLKRTMQNPSSSPICKCTFWRWIVTENILIVDQRKSMWHTTWYICCFVFKNISEPWKALV